MTIRVNRGVTSVFCYGTKRQRVFGEDESTIRTMTSGVYHASNQPSPLREDHHFTSNVQRAMGKYVMYFFGLFAVIPPLIR